MVIYMENRRTFLRNSLIATAGTALSMGTTLKINAMDTPKESNKTKMPLSEKSILFMKMIGIKYPIIQAPTGGVVKPSMTIAVADEGVLGAIPLTWTSPESSFEYIQTIIHARVEEILSLVKKDLKKKLKQAETEREILKKAAAYFAKQNL